jgi:hypothetical protein
VGLILLLLLSGSASGAATGIRIGTDRTDYVLGAPVTATVDVTYEGSVDAVPPALVEWFSGSGRLLGEEWIVLQPNGTGRLRGIATWTATSVGESLTVRATVNDTANPPAVLTASTTFRVRSGVAADLTQGRVVALFLVVFGLLIFALVVAVPVLRARQRDAEAHAPKALGDPGTELEPGASYVIAEGTPDRAAALFREIVHQGARGLAVTRLYPDAFRRAYGLDGVRTLWLSRAFGRGSVNPTNLPALVDEVERHLSGTMRSVVLFEGLDYLLVQNEEEEVQRFLKALRSAIALHRSVLLLSFDPERLTGDERARLLRGFLSPSPSFTRFRA